MSKRRKRKPSVLRHKFTVGMQKKLVMLFIAILLAFVILVGRITYINASSGEDYTKTVLDQQQYMSRSIPFKRGDIVDTNGTKLATSERVYNVILDAKVLLSDETKKAENIAATKKALKSYFQIKASAVDAIIADSPDSRYNILKKGISYDDAKAFEAAEKKNSKIKGIWLEEDYVRKYPYNTLACDVLGFSVSGNVGASGLEASYNSTLNGTDGRRYGYQNEDSAIENTVKEPINGNTIVTTIDANLQSIVEKHLEEFNQAHTDEAQEGMGFKNGAVIMMNPNTGEVLAMASSPTYDLNNPRDLSAVYTEDEIKAMNDVETVEALNGMWSNFCVTDAYEPGSVVKPIVMASALEKGAIQETDTFVCDGSQTFGDTMIKCAVYPSAHGTETLGEVIANSCNDAMMQIGAKMGATQFIKAQSLFNFGTRTGIDLPNEGAGIIHTKDSMGETELACSAFGQGFTCTMIQEINAMSSVINGGYYYQPHLVTKVLDSNGGTIKTISPILLKQTISSRISSDIRSYMALSVQQGTSRHSKVQGYSSGGKTGTAEKYPRGNGKYLVSFIGFAPVDDPAVVIYVVVDEPNVEDQANSTYPQYIAQGILSELLPYLNVVPDESEDGTVPETELWEGFKGHLKSTSISDSELDSDGNLVDADGNLIDWDGNRIDENGYLLDANGDHILDEEGNYKMSTNLVSASGSTDADSSGDAVSNPDAPAPLEDDEAETTEDNDEETDGITNEEAGLE